MFLLAAQQAFYEAAAQIIPVLLLVLAVELVGYREPRESVWVSYAFLILLLGMIAGEASALGALVSGHDSVRAEAWTSFGIGLGVGVVAQRAGLLLRDNVQAEHSERATSVFEAVVLVVSLGAIAVVTGALILAN